MDHIALLERPPEEVSAPSTAPSAAPRSSGRFAGIAVLAAVAAAVLGISALGAAPAMQLGAADLAANSATAREAAAPGAPAGAPAAAQPGAPAGHNAGGHQAAAPGGGSPAGPQPAPTEHTIKMAGLKFVPQTVNVALSDTVTWVNDDTAAHTVTVTDGSAATASQNLVIDIHGADDTPVLNATALITYADTAADEERPPAVAWAGEALTERADDVQRIAAGQFAQTPRPGPNVLEQEAEHRARALGRRACPEDTEGAGKVGALALSPAPALGGGQHVELARLGQRSVAISGGEHDVGAVVLAFEDWDGAPPERCFDPPLRHGSPAASGPPARRGGRRRWPGRRRSRRPSW